MTPTKLLVEQILIVLCVVIAGTWLAKQTAAHELGYQARLGAPWFELSSLPVYRPWSLFGWWYHYGPYAPEVFDRAGALAAASTRRFRFGAPTCQKRECGANLTVPLLAGSASPANHRLYSAQLATSGVSCGSASLVAL